MHTLHGYALRLLSEEIQDGLKTILKKNRPYAQGDTFFEPNISDLHDPYLLPDMEVCVRRILHAREKRERIIIFGDYDVDGVSSTAILVRFLTEIGCEVSYRLPHRVHDGYGLKEYFFDDLASKDVRLVITVDCGTRDVGPIRYARSLGIDVIVTDHHAVPDIVPDEVIGIINPKRKDSQYPFTDLAGAGVAFKLVHALAIAIEDTNSHTDTMKNNKNNSAVSSVTVTVSHILQRYVDFASLGTVSDCMPIVGENRTITTLGLKRMQNSSSSGLRKFLEGQDKITENDADIIGFQIGPRINAAGRIDTPLTALRWLLASEDNTDTFFSELEHLNETRKNTTTEQLEQALEHVDTSLPILFYDASNLEHGIIGLVAGKLTEMYGKPSIIIKNGHNHPLTRRKGDEVDVDESTVSVRLSEGEGLGVRGISVASCRSPDWCSMIELLDGAKDLFVRYGGHRQAAGFTIEESRIGELKSRLLEKFSTMHDVHNLPKRVMDIECILDPVTDFTLENLDVIDSYRPFGIGNRKPLFLLRDETILEVKPLGKEGKHLEIRLVSNPGIKLVAWGWGNEGRVKSEEGRENTKKGVISSEVPKGEVEKSSTSVPGYTNLLQPGNIVSLVVELDRNIWNGKESVSVIVKDLVV